jgi:hypothetical protein
VSAARPTFAPGRRPLLAAVAILAALAVFAALPVAAQEEEDLTAGFQALRQAFDRARAAIDNLDFQGAVRDLGSIIEPRRAARAADLQPEELTILCSAYDLRARAQFNLGNPKGAGADFEALLHLDPAYPIDRQTLSPKVVDLFDRTRARIAGMLVLDAAPARGRITVDGDPVEADDQGRLILRAGTRLLRYEADGHDPFEQRIVVVAGAEARLAARLRPNRRTLQFITVPAEVTVSLDGKPIGSTRGPAAAGIEALATQYNFDPKQASAPIEAPLVTPGDHRVSFERPCYQTQTLTVKVALDVENNTPLRFAPVVLQEARHELKITAWPVAGEVSIDGERRGRTPLTVSGLCGGERDILVDGGEAGSWSERIRLVAGQANVLDVRLRPTLIYAGTFRLDEWGRAVWSDQDKPLLDEINKGLKTLNTVRDPAALEAARVAIVKWLISDPRAARAGTIVPPAVLEEIAGRTRADLVLAGLTTAEEGDPGATLALYSARQRAPDLVTLRFDRPDAVRGFVRRLDTTPDLAAPWWGMGLADVPGARDAAGGDAAVVVRVIPGGPASVAGLAAGDRIVSVAGRETRAVRDVDAALAAEAERPGGVKTLVTLAVANSAGTRTVRMAPADGPRVLPLADPSILYNRALAEFRLRARGLTEETGKGIALLNLGVAYMHFRDYDRASSEGLGRAELPAGPGIAAGSLDYYRGLCALRRGDPETARRHLQAAAAATGATLDHGDGPSAAAAAARLIAALP